MYRMHQKCIAAPPLGEKIEFSLGTQSREPRSRTPLLALRAPCCVAYPAARSRARLGLLNCCFAV